MKLTEYLSKNVHHFMLDDLVLELVDIQDDFIVCQAAATDERYIVPLGSIKYLHGQNEHHKRLEMLA